MSKDKDILGKVNRREGMTVPEGYFDDFTAKMISSLPEKQKVPEISKLVKRAGASIHSMEILDESDMKRSKKKETSTIKIIVFPKSEESLDLIVSTLRSDENIIDVYVD